MSSFSIVVPGALGGLERLLPLLARLQRPAAGVEVLVVDDDERSAAVIEGWRDRIDVRHVLEAAPAGRARRRDRGWRAASGDVMVFLDPDMLVGPTWLVELERALARSGADVISGARGWTDGRGIEQPGLHPGPISGALEAELAGLCATDPQPVLVAFAAQAANLAVRRRALEQTSGFNTFLRRFDDVELGLRLWETGARFAYAAEARAIHRCEPDAGDGWVDDDEAQALFWRHPYRDLLRIHVWARRRRSRPIALADVTHDSAELRRELGESAPGPHTWAEVDLYAQLERMYDRDLGAHVRRGIERGLYFEEQGGARTFQLDRIDDWMRDTTPLLQINYSKDLAGALFRADPDLSRPATMIARARLRVALDPDALARAGIKGLNLSMPVERSGQRAVEILGASIPSLLDAARASRGMIAGYPVAEVAAAGGHATVDFSFQVSVPMSGSVDDTDPAGQLAVSLPPAYRERAEQMLTRLRLPDDPFDAGRIIHEWLEDEVLFGNIPPQHPYYRVLDFGSGICIQQIRLFVALCRLRGIPAREVCGALMQWGGEEQAKITKDVSTRGYSPFSHSWAEFLAPGRGWVPTELRGFGRRGFTPQTAPDPDLRREIQRVLYDRYPFGTLHPFRVIVGPQANRLAPLQMPPGVDPALARRALDSTFFHVECTFTRAGAA